MTFTLAGGTFGSVVLTDTGQAASKFLNVRLTPSFSWSGCGGAGSPGCRALVALALGVGSTSARNRRVNRIAAHPTLPSDHEPRSGGAFLWFLRADPRSFLIRWIHCWRFTATGRLRAADAVIARTSVPPSQGRDRNQGLYPPCWQSAGGMARSCLLIAISGPSAAAQANPMPTYTEYTARLRSGWWATTHTVCA